MANKIETYEQRRKSRIVVTMINHSGVSKKDISEALGISLDYFNNKLTRDSFSLDDLLVIAEVCGFELQLVKVTKTVFNLKDL